MNAQVKPRALPVRPVVSLEHLRDPRFARHTANKVDLSAWKGLRVSMTVEGIVELTNIDPRNIEKLINLGIVGARNQEGGEVIGFDPAITRTDIYLSWSQNEPRPSKLEHFDHILAVRNLLHLPAEAPHPPQFVEAAIEFLNEHGCAHYREVAQLLHASFGKDDPTRALFAELTGSTKRRPKASATMKTLRAKLAPALRELEGTALSEVDNQENAFAVPSPEVLGDLIAMKNLRAPATAHIFRLTARVVSDGYLLRVLNGLKDIDERIETIRERQSLSCERASEAVLRELMHTSGENGREGRKAGSILSAWSGMIDDLRVAAVQLNAQDSYLLRWPGTILPEEVAANRNRRNLIERKTKGESRLSTSSGLADDLPQIIRSMDNRYREIEDLRVLAEAARDKLCADITSRSVPIVQEVAELDTGGHSTGAIVRHRFRLWNTLALLEHTASVSKFRTKDVPLYASLSTGRFSKAISPWMLIYEGSSGNPPWYEQLFRVCLFNPSRTLPPETRQARYDLIRDMQLPIYVSRLKNLVAYDRSDATAARVLLGEGHVAIPIEEFSAAMQIAHTAFGVAIVTAARVGEITQIKSDGSNFGYDEDAGLAYWRAQPKQSSDTMDPAPIVRRYYLDDQTLACVVSLKETMGRVFGKESIARPINPSSNLKKLGRGAWLFRSESSMLHPSSIKALLQYLSVGIGSFGIHDVRAAIAKHRYDQGDSMTEIRDLLGHGGIGSTKAYARPTENMTARRRSERQALSQTDRRLARLDEMRGRMA